MNPMYERQNPMQKSTKKHYSNNGNKREAAKHLLQNPEHIIHWQEITSVSNQLNKSNILEVYNITKFKPSLNNQLNIKITYPFRNCITLE